MSTDGTLSLSTVTHVIQAPLEQRVQVVWELSARKLDDRTCEYSNHLHGMATDETMAFFRDHGIPFEQGSAARQQALDTHNREETPNFAKSIERRAMRQLAARTLP